MYEPPAGSEVVLTTRHRMEFRDARLVLEAVGIASESVHRDGCWWLVVGAEDRAAAMAELEAYWRENQSSSHAPHAGSATYGGAGSGVLMYATAVMSIALLSSLSVLELDWYAAGSMQAGQVMGGQLWRVVTALTLHVDAGHLASNLLFGAVFGYLAGQALGGGVAWLAILLGGALGNLANAMVQASSHTSIGASTAVFAALGLLVAHALRPRVSAREMRLRRWRPLVGGVLLLAFIGVGGERTDVVAHVTGFVSGLIVGWIGCRLPATSLDRPSVQSSAAAVSLAVLAASWCMALLAE